MNKAILMGRLTRDPEIRYSSGDEPTAIARYTLAVDRRYKRQGDDQTADFINCVVFGRGAEFAENYLHQGTKIVAVGRIQTGSYTNKDGHRFIPQRSLLRSRSLQRAKRQQRRMKTEAAVQETQQDRHRHLIRETASWIFRMQSRRSCRLTKGGSHGKERINQERIREN